VSECLILASEAFGQHRFGLMRTSLVEPTSSSMLAVQAQLHAAQCCEALAVPRDFSTVCLPACLLVIEPEPWWEACVYLQLTEY
jgi:hypothetical protein